MAATHFSLKKFLRKTYKDGFHSAIDSSIEAIYRKKIFPYLFPILIDNGAITVLDDNEIYNKSNTKSPIRRGDTTAFVSELDSGFIFPESGLVLTEDLELINAAIGAPQYSVEFTTEALAHHDFTNFWLTPRLIFRDRELDREYIPGRVCALAPRYKNYYHWMVGTIPKLRYAKKYEQDTGNEVMYLLPSDLPTWGQETISLLGIPEKKLITAQSGVYRPDRLILPPHPYPGHVDDYNWIRNQIFDKINEGNEPTSCIYISRSKALGRQVSNETEVMDVLDDFGFEKLYLEDRSVSQNIHAFMNAEVIVAPHGAGLTDILFCDTDCAILELFGSQKTQAYEQLAEILDLEYHRMDCQPDGTDMVVNTMRLRQNLNKIFEK
jgi:hypothetical protein